MSDDRIEISLPDCVCVRGGKDYENSIVFNRRGMTFGDWYVIENTSPDAILDNPDSNFDVGHNPTGMKLIGGMAWWDARRIAMAMDDADLVIELPPTDADMKEIVDGVIGAALMDHYVFPLINYVPSGGDS